MQLFLNIATYTDKQEEITEMMQRKRIDPIGMAETRHFGKERGKDLGGGFVLMYSGVRTGRRKHGVAIIVGPTLSPYTQEVKLLNESLMYCVLNIRGKKYFIYQMYAPQQGHTDEEKREYMEMLEDNIDPNRDNVTLITGNFNARVGQNRRGI